MAANPSTLQELRSTQLAPRVEQMPAVRAEFFDSQGFELLQRVAKAFSASTLVPATYQNSLPNCMIALNIARRLRADELMVMQNLYIVHGNPGWSAKFLIASVNTCGRFSAMRYEWRGDAGTDDYGCRAWAIERETGERLNGVWVDWRMVKAEGWSAKNGSKWKTMADQMFIYRAAAFWQRAYAPEISMGLSTAEELADVIDVNPDGTVTMTTESFRQQAPAQSVVIEDQTKAADAETKADAKPAEPPMSFAEIEQSLRAAKTIDDLDALAGMIQAFPREQQPDLSAEYGRLRKKLTKE